MTSVPGRFLYLHGFASSPASKKAQFFRQRFEDWGIKLEIPDLAQGDFENLTISGQLDVVHRLLEPLAGQPASQPITLMGSSMGGYVAALYAERHPAIHSLVLLAPAFGLVSRWPEWLGEKQMEDWKRSRKLPVYHYGDRKTRYLDYRLIEEARSYPEYPECIQRALIFHGSKDMSVPLSCSTQFARNRPDVRLRILDSGHELLDHVDLMWGEMSEFLNIL